LNLHGVQCLAEACVQLSVFRHHDHPERLHSALTYLTPSAFKTAWLGCCRALAVWFLLVTLAYVRHA
jgi:hypothetical protein